MTTFDHQTLREAIGAYVLGQLDGELLDALEEHLRTCDECRTEIAELGPLVAPLQALASTTPAPTALDARVDRSLATAGRARWPRWARYGAAFAVGAAAASLVAALAWPDPVAPGPPMEQVASVEARGGIDASASLINHTWGTEIILVATGMREGARYRVFVVDTDGRLHPSGGFVGVGVDQMTCRLNSPLLRADAAGFEVRGPRGEVLITGTLAS